MNAKPSKAVLDQAHINPLPDQQRLLDEVEKALDEIRAGGNSKGILFCGPAGTGKTTGLDFVAETRLPFIDGIQRRVPCCRVAASSAGNAKALAQMILHQLGKPSAVTGRLTQHELEAQLQEAISACGVEVLILEELNNALVTSGQLYKHTANFLKGLWNQNPVDHPDRWSGVVAERGDKRLVIIVSGVEDLVRAFDQDDQLGSRYSCRVQSRLLLIGSKDDRLEFRCVFESMLARYGLDDIVDLSDSSMLARSMLACSSSLRRLESLVERAGTLRRRGFSTEPIEALFSKAFEECQRAAESHENPFHWDREELKQRVAAATMGR